MEEQVRNRHKKEMLEHSQWLKANHVTESQFYAIVYTDKSDCGCGDKSGKKTVEQLLKQADENNKKKNNNNKSISYANYASNQKTRRPFE
jgi:hypothetical protein